MTRYKPTELVAVSCGPTGIPAGRSHHWTKWPDETVASARKLRQEGMSCPEIARVLGVPQYTVYGWCSGYRRKLLARVIMRRRQVKESPIEQ